MEQFSVLLMLSEKYQKGSLYSLKSDSTFFAWLNGMPSSYLLVWIVLCRSHYFMCCTFDFFEIHLFGDNIVYTIIPLFASRIHYK